jgi:hypothetical protein
MRLFLDTEFNGFMGPLMSMALVPEDDSVPKFYKELEMKDQLDPWVKEHVVPFMDGKPVGRIEFQNSLARYLLNIGECTIVADWPDDIRHFCESLIVGPGDSIVLAHKIHFELDTKLPYVSQVPHHALFDAIGIREAYLEKLNK